jgi:hypothetical protein
MAHTTIGQLDLRQAATKHGARLISRDNRNEMIVYFVDDHPGWVTIFTHTLDLMSFTGRIRLLIEGYRLYPGCPVTLRTAYGREVPVQLIVKELWTIP